MRTTTDALVVRAVPYGEADVVATLFTEALGRVSALARGARRSAKRFGGALDPMHTVRVTVEERAGTELATMREASVVRARVVLMGDLARLEAAGCALRWVRSGSPPRLREPEVWHEIVDLLDRLDDRADALGPERHLGATGLRLLGAFGWGLELGACVRCGRPCDPARPAYVDAAAGGLVCRACGGASILLDAGVRTRLAQAAAGADDRLLPEDAALARRLVEAALAAHAGVAA